MRGAGRYKLSPRTLVTVSLAEPWVAEPGGEAYSYKVVAAIIEPERGTGGGRWSSKARY